MSEKLSKAIAEARASLSEKKLINLALLNDMLKAANTVSVAALIGGLIKVLEDVNKEVKGQSGEDFETLDNIIEHLKTAENIALTDLQDN